MHLGAGLRRAGRVADDQRREVGERELADRRGQRSAAVAHGVQRRRVVVVAVELVEQRTEHGVADDRERVDPLPLDRSPDVGRVEVPRVVRQHDGRTLGHHHERGPLGGSVHQRREHAELQPEAVVDPVGQVVVTGHPFPRPDPATTHGGDEDVVLAPEHALGHAGRPAGVEDVEVVRGRLDVGPVGRSGGQRPFVRDGAGQRIVAGVVVDVQQDVDRRHLVEHLGQRRGERGVVDDGPRRAVTEQVPQLFADVPVVDVERRHPGAVGADHALEVLVAVVEGEGDVVLPGLVTGQPGPSGRAGSSVRPVPLRPDAEAAVVEVRRQAPGSLGELAVRQPPVTPDEALAVGQRPGDRLDDPSQIELRPCAARCSPHLREVKRRAASPRSPTGRPSSWCPRA